MDQQLKTNQIMKNFMQLLTLLLIITSCCEKQNAPEQQNIEQTILTLEKNALDRWSNADQIGFSDNFAEDATLFDFVEAHVRINGIENLKKYFASFQGKVPIHKYELINPKVQVYGDMAILSFWWKIEDEIGEPSWKATSVYRLHNDTWKIVHAHWSEVKE